MFDEYSIDVYFTDGHDDADQRKVVIGRTEACDRKQARRHVMMSIGRFAPPAATVHHYWVGYATAMFECTDPNRPMFLNAREGGRELSISIRPV